jgi:parallel beta-helix repeat protein
MKRCITLLLALFLCCASHGFSQVSYFAGIIDSDTSWSSDTIKITGDVTINNGVTLIIPPGAYVEFQGHYWIDVKGRILAIGIPGDSIIFTINDTTGFSSDSLINAGGWKGFRIVQALSSNDTSVIAYSGILFVKSGCSLSIVDFSKVKIENCSLKHFRKNNCGCINCQNGSPVIRNNEISNSDANGIALTWYSSPLITGNTINDHKYSGIWCIYNCNPVIMNNTVSHCTWNGIKIVENSSAVVFNNRIQYNDNILNTGNPPGGGIYIENASPLISHNIITNNTSAGGGGIACVNSSAYIVFNIIANNSSTETGCEGWRGRNTYKKSFSKGH